MWGRGSVAGRLALTVAAVAIAATGVVVAADGSASAGGTPRVAVAPAALSGCAATGPYAVPELTSAGVPAGLTLCRSGPITITEPGAVVDGWEIGGGIVVDARDVVVRRSRIIGDGSVPYGIRTTRAGSVRIEDTTLTGDFPEAAVGDDRWTGTRIEITRVTHDGARLGVRARLRNSAVHDFAPGPETLAHGVVLHGTGSDVLVEDCRVEPGPAAASAVWVAATASPRVADGPGVIRGNVLGGGRSTVREEPVSGIPTDLLIAGNRFQRAVGVVPLQVSPHAVLIDNRYVDGGMLPAR
ncbi:hypothetical protein [Pseudonocardia sp. GCM10023141]|uniref:hypothetical protein n=1 Tax=Pseudonocardia sp. GCM10023141 TaxID=3252653 RepID=UPI0036093484